MKTEEESTLDTSCEIQVDYTSENGCQTYFFSYNESTNVTNLYRVTSLQVRFQDSEETVFYHDAWRMPNHNTRSVFFFHFMDLHYIAHITTVIVCV
jgi:hypothetical protein